MKSCPFFNCLHYSLKHQYGKRKYAKPKKNIIVCYLQIVAEDLNFLNPVFIYY